KSGQGVLVLTNSANTYAGGIIVTGGRLDVGSDSELGAANPTVNPAGTLRYTASATTTRAFNLAGGTLESPSGVTLILNGAAVNGGFLAGPGTFTVMGGTTLNGATSSSSTNINQVGQGSYANFTNGGLLTMAAGMTSPVVFLRVTNQGSGTITVGAGSQINASDFQSYGVLTLNPGSSPSSATRLTNTGSSPIYMNGGSRTFVGSAVSPN